MRTVSELLVFDGQEDNQAAFTADDTTEIITSSSHGLSDNDAITVGSSGTLPAGLSANTVYYVISSTTNTFKVSTTPGGSAVNITDTGTGTHTWYEEFESKNVFVEDFDEIMIAVHTSGSTSATLFACGAQTDEAPTFINPASESNRYELYQLLDMTDVSAVNGTTGIVLTGTDQNKGYKLNVAGLKWFALKTQDFQAGKLTVSVKSYIA